VLRLYDDRDVRACCSAAMCFLQKAPLKRGQTLRQAQVNKNVCPTDDLTFQSEYR